MSSSLPILQELYRLQTKHKTSKINSTIFQPNEQEQEALIAKNYAEKLVALEIRKETQKYVYNETMKIYEAKRMSESVQNQNESESNDDNRAHTAPTPSSHSKSSSSLPRIHKYDPNTSQTRPSTAEFASLLKESFAPNEVFENNISYQIDQQTKNSNNVFQSIVNHFKAGTLCQFSARSTVETVDVSDHVVAPQGSYLQTSLRLEDLAAPKKRDGMVIIMDPTTDTSNQMVYLRISYKKVINFNTDEDCVKEYEFYSNGNYFGLHLYNDYSSIRDSMNASGVSTAQSTRNLISSHSSRNLAGSSFNGLDQISTLSKQMSTRSINSEQGTNNDGAVVFIDSDTVRQKSALPGWSSCLPIFIPATKCEIQILYADMETLRNPVVLFNMSKLRLYAITATNTRQGIKKLNDFCDSYFQSATANLCVPGGVSALNIAALHGNLEAVTQLIANGANINLRNKGSKYNTALHEAVIGGFKDVVKYLLQMNANQLLKDDQGNTPMHLACKMNDIAIARILINSPNGKRALISVDNNDKKPIDICGNHFMKIRIEGAMRKLKIFVKPRVSILDR